MKLGIISDIHANHDALSAVLADMTSSVDQIVCAGDILGYYRDVNEVCETVIEEGIFSIRGNHDAYILGELFPDPKKVCSYKTEWTKSQLDPKNLDWLSKLKDEQNITVDEKHIKIRHASPWDEVTYLYKDSVELNRIKLADNEILILGHTHHPMQVKCGNGFVINPGSVGQPRDWNPKASYVVFDSRTTEFKFYRVAYDVKKYQKKLSEENWSKEMIMILSREK